MIEEYLMNQAMIVTEQLAKDKKISSDLEWTVNYVTREEATGTVYDEGGSNGNVNNDANTMYPNYMFWIRSPKIDWDVAKIVAYQLYTHFHKKSVDDIVHVPELDKSYRVLFMQAMSPPNPIGVIDDVMVYSLNIQATIEEEL